MRSIKDRFSLKDKVVIITGGAGLLGVHHSEAVAEFGGIPLLLDVNDSEGTRRSKEISEEYNADCRYFNCDITDEASVRSTLDKILGEFQSVYALINNAAKNEKMEEGSEIPNHRLEDISVETWRKDMDISVTGAFLCSRIFGPHFVENGGGVILNISSDLGIISPDQRIYQKVGIADDEQIVKPVTYSVVKHALIGLTKYLSTYWLGKNVRANTLCPGGVFSGQPGNLLSEIEYRIPLGRMAHKDEYKAAVVFLLSEASSYMNGATLVMDGGRSVW